MSESDAPGAAADAECAVYVPSCDAYADLWAPFFSLFWSRWPDCPFQVYLGANARTFAHPRVATLPSSQGNNWSNRVLDQLASIPAPYVLMMLEDFFLDADVETDRVRARLADLRRLDGAVMRLVRMPGPDELLPGGQVGRIEPGSPYRACTQAAIWNKAELMALMRRGESIWEFEHEGTKRSCGVRRGFYAVSSPAISYGHHVVERGKWFHDSAGKYGPRGIGCDFSARGVMAWSASARRVLLGKAFLVFLNAVPWRVRNRLYPAVSRIAASIPLLRPAG